MDFGKLLSVTVRVGVGAVAGVATCAVRTAADCGRVVSKVADGEWSEAGDIVFNRAMMPVKAAVATVGVSAELLGDAVLSAVDEKREFLTDENVNKLTNLASVGLAVGIGASVIGDSPDYPEAPVNGPFLTDSGMFEGDEEDLQALIAQGEVEGTDHVPAEDLTRSIAARNEFLAAHGYDSVPDGYEVHHIVPLSEGGTDTPDNMILLSEEDHDTVTAAHRRFYGWNA